MAGRIIILPGELTEKIAAGEVIERPASIVKELLENALDAGATDITVEIEKGGRGGLKITDNGDGMSAEELPLAFARFATSKIYRFDDIYAVTTYGFRGEALPSIASVCRVEMVSRRRDDPSGTRIVIEAGDVREIIAAGCPPGTTVSVSRIFESVPVRKKFLKSDATEQGACLDAITRIALARPEVRMRVLANGREVLAVPATGDVGERLVLILGDIAAQTTAVHASRGGLTVSGFASRPEFTHARGQHIYCYVNRRFVRDRLLHSAVMAAYKHVIEARRYPAAVVFLSLPPGDVDVNVHPTKLEVKFRNPREIYECIAAAFADHLARRAPGSVPVRPVFSGVTARTAAEGEGRSAGGGTVKRYVLSIGEEKLLFRDASAPDVPVFPDVPVAPAAERGGTDGASPAAPLPEAPGEAPPQLSDLSYLGQVARSYLVFSAPDGLVLVDQHAAHERVLFEKFRAAGAEGAAVASQALLVPEVVSLPPGEIALLADLLPLMHDAGMDVEPFGGDAVVIKAVPALLSHVDPKTLLFDMLHEFGGAEHARRTETLYTFLACRGAVKAGQTLSAPEVNALCRSLDASPFAATCPHGRPVRVLVGVADLEKIFKRR